MGKVRPLNEDYHRFWEFPFRDRFLTVLGVADGMGGAAAGEEASRIAIHVLGESFSRYVAEADRGRPVVGLDRVAEKAVLLANKRVHDAAVSGTGRHGMGTTLTFAVIYGRNAWLGHVGDSRAYLIRFNEIIQLTSDHTWVAEQIGLGLLTREDAVGHEWRNVLIRALGLQSSVTPDVVAFEVRSGDFLLLTSDGLTGHVSDEEILKEVTSGRSAQSSVDFLIAQANSRGGDDNITLILLEVP